MLPAHPECNQVHCALQVWCMQTAAAVAATSQQPCSDGEQYAFGAKKAGLHCTVRPSYAHFWLTFPAISFHGMLHGRVRSSRQGPGGRSSRATYGLQLQANR
jgi:hypothetical protein